MGWSVASAGDVNGDGFSDVIAGVLLYDNVQSEEGGAFVYHGFSRRN
ncbi:MAG: FG-GAP repeat protein [Chitinophagaceae bacterium]|nr:FG-GAP repeat protein [Chitinophagaceae bacterium]